MYPMIRVYTPLNSEALGAMSFAAQISMTADWWALRTY